MSILESIFYGFISGITEILPISSRGHQAILNELFGIRTPVPVLNIFVRIAVLLAIIFSSTTYIDRLRRFDAKRSVKHKVSQVDKAVFYDIRLIKSAVLPMLIVMLLHLIFQNLGQNMIITALLFAVNGAVVYLPEHLPHGNKESSKLSAMDGFLMGVSRGLAVLPGLSGIGTGLSLCIARGTDSQKSFNWLLILSIPANIFFVVLEIISVFVTGVGAFNFIIFIGCLLAFVVTFVCAFASIYLMRVWILHNGFAAFGFYSWGAAILCFVLFLTA